MTTIRLLGAALVVTLLGTGAGVAVRGTADPAAGPSRVAPLAVLHAWDAARARAWARGDPEALRALYTPGSAAGRADRRLLAAYAARGLRVEGLAVQVLAARTISSSPDRLALRVTDRVTGARAVGRGTATPLPRDEVSIWTLVLRRVAGTWKVASVRR